MSTTPGDAPLMYTFNDAQEYASRLDAHAHDDWRVPPKKELNVLFQNRAAIGGFEISGSNPATCFVSSSKVNNVTAWGQRYMDGDRSTFHTYYDWPLRCVR